MPQLHDGRARLLAFLDEHYPQVPHDRFGGRPTSTRHRSASAVFSERNTVLSLVRLLRLENRSKLDRLIQRAP